MSFTKRNVAAIAASLMCLSACAHESKPEPTLSVAVFNNTLVGQEWRVEDMSNKGIIDNTLMTLNFDAQGRVHGNSTCNLYNAAYTVDAATITIGSGMITERACLSPSLMNQEAEFMSIFNALKTYSFTPTNALVLKTADGRSITARH